MDSLPPPPPPPYTEHNSATTAAQPRVNRKPVPSQAPARMTGDIGTSDRKTTGSSQFEDVIDAKEGIPPLPPRPDLSGDTSAFPSAHPSEYTPGSESQVENIVDPNNIIPPLPPRRDLSREISVSPSIGSSTPASTATGISSPTYAPPSRTSTATTASSSSSKSSTASYFQNAYREARYFAGGLIAHPFESTKHFTILRHSNGLVFYKGASTSLAISIFSDSPVPSDRTLWLQSKGWTGKTGMRAKALVGRTGNWINVTPTLEVSSSQLDSDDERAWQRDIASFRKKAGAKIRDTHILRETAIVRIPVEAEDGYFQLVLSAGDKKKTLCPSPVFRILSTSRSPSSIRGASLSTLPLELGAMVLGTYASNTVGRVISPVTSTIQGSVQQYMPSWKTQQAAMAAYGMSGVETKVNTALEDANGQYDETRQISLMRGPEDEHVLEQGPVSPYPIRFFGYCETGSSHEVDQSNLPACTLSHLDSTVLQRFYGHYFGWTRRSDKSGNNSYPWYQVAMSVLPIDPSLLDRVSIASASKRVVTVRVLTEETHVLLDQARFEVLVMGFIRPDEPKQRANLARGLQDGDEAAFEAAMLSEVQDMSVVQSYLDHSSWAPEPPPKPEEPSEKQSTLDRAKTAYANTRLTAQNRIDKIPLHKLGIRAPSESMKDKTIIANGFFVPRG